MEPAIGILTLYDVVLVLVEHFGNEHLELYELTLVDSGRSQGTSFAFDGAPCFEQLERPNVSGSCLAAGRLLVHDIDAGACAHIHQAIQLESNDRLTDGWSRNLEGLCELSFRRQALPDLVSANCDV